jgi:hypothetical protein
VNPHDRKNCAPVLTGGGFDFASSEEDVLRMFRVKLVKTRPPKRSLDGAPSGVSKGAMDDGRIIQV